MTNSQKQSDTIERTNGIPYIDTDNTKFGQWETGDYFIRLGREDGEKLQVNLTPEQAETMSHAFDVIDENSEVEA